MPGKIKFGVYELDADSLELRKHGVVVRLQEQPLRVLVALTERPGEIVTREELQTLIWGKDTFVDFEQSLNKAVNRLRETYNDNAVSPATWRPCRAGDTGLWRRSATFLTWKRTVRAN